MRLSQGLSELKEAAQRKYRGEFIRRAEQMQMSCGGNKLCVFEEQESRDG